MDYYEFIHTRCKTEHTKDTVRGWIEKGYIPGATYDMSTGNFNIPKYALPPYTKAKAKGNDIYGSILYAVLNDMRPIHQKYGLEENVFYSVYIDYLVERNLLRTFVDEGVTYFNKTPESKNYEGFTLVKIQKALWKIVQVGVVFGPLVAPLLK